MYYIVKELRHGSTAIGVASMGISRIAEASFHLDDFIAYILSRDSCEIALLKNYPKTLVQYFSRTAALLLRSLILPLLKEHAHL